jgi:hypothetical protein
LADVEALSVDVLYGFGAKNFNHCTEFIQLDILGGVNRWLFIGHFSVFNEGAGSVMVRFGKKCVISGRAAAICKSSGGLRQWFVVKPATFAGMLPSSRLVRDLMGWALS